ncbi:MAG: hypothetical protein HOV71_19755 [Hamadaea sp.]|uniref:DUF7873 family protein n=1 Tax=Hamadaea sp. NPDC050747 TaxID=3155789 RepID=UPI0017A1F8B0|nr:hypothetical protein [Hamadaea sp.]NUR50367.1 hypothetical protein [Hamadaea sp.]NUT04912.1 hypothetical protein [Hamadaea sp.]
MTKLNQIIALEKGVKATAETTLTKAYHEAQKPDLFAGLIRTYEPLEEDGYVLPSESKKVTAKVPALVSEIQAAVERLIDLTLTKDTANAGAKADVKVGDTVLARDVPVTTLLWLEKQLTNLRTFISKLPVTDVADDWTWDADNQVFRSATVKTMRSRKSEDFIVVVPPTDKHPAHVEKVTKDVPEGTWSTTKLSGAVSPSQRDTWLAQVTAVTEAVKTAREQANLAEVVDAKMGKAILDFIFTENRA